MVENKTTWQKKNRMVENRYTLYMVENKTTQQKIKLHVRKENSMVEKN